MKPGEILEKGTANELKVTFRYLKWSDIDGLMDFANKISREDTFVMLSGEEITRKQEVTYVSKALGEMENGERIHLVITSSKKIIGNAEVRPDDRRRKHIGIVTIAIDKDARGRGLGARLLKHIIDESKKHGFRLLMISVFEINAAGIKAYNDAGFIKYGKVPGALYYKGEYVDEVYFYKDLVKY